MKKHSSMTLLFTGLAIGIAGCNGSGGTDSTGSTGSTASKGGKTYEIAVIPKGSTHEYWKSVQEGAQKAEAELGDVHIQWTPPLKEDDRDSQINIVSNAITKGVDGIVLAPLDNVALGKPVKEAVSAKIPVVIIDSGLVGGGYISAIMTDNEKGGQTAADNLSKLLNGKGKVVMLKYEEGSASTMAREKGFMEEIAKSPGIEVVSHNLYGGATVATAQQASENLLSSYRQGDGLSIDGIYTPNESTTAGMLLVLEGAKFAGKVKFVGFDANQKLLEGLTKGEINGLIIQDPRKMGYLGVKTIEKYLKGDKNVDKDVDTGATYVDKDSMTKPDIQKLIAPPVVK